MESIIIDGVKVFRGDTGLSISVFSDRDASGTKELDNVVSNLEKFYRIGLQGEEPKILREQERVDNGESFLYRVLTDSEEYIGSVKITPKGSFFRKGDSCPDEDYLIADQTRYLETYWINFFPKDKNQRRTHRENYINFIDPSGRKTKRN